MYRPRSACVGSSSRNKKNNLLRQQSTCKRPLSAESKFLNDHQDESNSSDVKANVVSKVNVLI